MTRSVIRAAACLSACAALAACSGFNLELPSKKVEYKGAGKLPPLDVPPDLTKPQADDRFAFPDTTRGAATFSEYQRGRESRTEAAGSGAVLPTAEGAHVERAGSQRWLVVKGDPQQIWPVVKDFWQDNGFTLNTELPAAGVMETDWAENRARVPDGFIRNTLGKLLDAVYSTSERDKYRTRLERGAQPGTTEVYISHRGMEEVYTSLANDETKWQPRPPDPELEAEMLRRLMVRLGVQEERAKTAVASAKPAPARAVLHKTGDGAGSLALNEQFDRAWRRVGLALDRVGFTVEDRDRSKGVYYVRYIDPEVDNKSADEKGFFGRFKFWGSSDKNKNEQYRVLVKDEGERAQVNVLNKDGNAERSATANRILTLLYDQLK
jgi:outer membrane protein assembly factor BamC